MKKTRNLSLNILKGIACICVIMLHCSFPGDVGRAIYGVSRFAVPLFFAIPGYYVYRNNEATDFQTLTNKVKHISALFLGTEVFYLFWHILQASIVYRSLQGATEWLDESFTVRNMVDFILFQNTFIGDVSWFLVALILCYAVTFPIARFNLWEKCIWAIVPLLCANILLGEVGSLSGAEIRWYWCSNFWLLGFPCYALGFYIRIHENEIMKLLTDRRILAGILVTGLLAVGERAVTGENQLYFANIPFMVFGFIFCLKHPEGISEKGKGIFKYLARIGEEYSFGVYILHPVARDVLKMSAGTAGIQDKALWGWCLPILTIVFSILLWKLWRIIFKNRNRLKKPFVIVGCLMLMLLGAAGQFLVKEGNLQGETVGTEQEKASFENLWSGSQDMKDI